MKNVGIYQKLGVAAAALALLLGYQNCSKQRFSQDPPTKVQCSTGDIDNYLDAAWVRETVTLHNLSIKGNDGALHLPLNTDKYFYASPSTVFSTSDYEKYSYLQFYLNINSETTSISNADYNAGYRRYVYFDRTPVARPDVFQDMRMQVTLANRWCQSLRDSSGALKYSTGLFDFEVNPNLPASYSPNQEVQIRCVSIAPPEIDIEGCGSNFANNPPVKTENFSYNEDYLATCTAFNNDNSLSPLEKNKHCGHALCATKGYQTGYMIEYNGSTNNTQAVCFRDTSFYNLGF